mgnify:CR=1 FL=1
MTKLNKNELEELKYHLADRIVDNMDIKDLVKHVFDDYIEYFDSISEVEFMNEAHNYWDDACFEEVIAEVKEYVNCKFKKPIEDREATNININLLENQNESV